VILTELEHASKHSNEAAYVEGMRGAKELGTRGAGRVVRGLGVRRDRASDRVNGRSAPGKRIRCNRLELSSRARELGAA